MPESDLNRSWEISSAPEEDSGGAGKGNRNPAIDADEKSDAPVVPEKLPNKGKPAEAVEERGAAKGKVQQNPARRTQSRASASKGLEGLREAARCDKRARFTALLHHVTPQLLEQSFYALRKEAAAGVDAVTWREYEPRLAQRLPELHRQIHVGVYRTQPSRRVHIPKPDGSLRPLGIAALEDKIVQQAVRTVLEAIYEADFKGFSYGFRPGKSAHDALDAVWVGIEQRSVRWIVDADIRAFFDTIDHEWMMKFLAHRIGDKRVLRLLHKWLQAGHIGEDGRRVASDRGTPQGAVISPLLANIYLHYVLDLWAHQWRRVNDAREMIVVRYADDFVVGLGSQQEAQTLLEAMHERFARFGLTLHAQKTRVIQFGRYAAIDRRRAGLRKPETFDFLGFTHCCGINRLGRFKIVRLTARKRIRATLGELQKQLRRRRHHPVAEVGRWLHKVLLGYYQYHAVPDNMRRLGRLRQVVMRMWLAQLRHRSQRHRMTWPRMNRLSRQYLPVPHRLHPYPPQRFAARTLGKSRMR
jgi:RNA-directed DNA polymerase